jgi:hypothetical protein
VAERLFSLISEDRMSEQAKTSEEALRASENERSYYALPRADNRGSMFGDKVKRRLTQWGEDSP